MPLYRFLGGKVPGSNIQLLETYNASGQYVVVGYGETIELTTDQHDAIDDNLNLIDATDPVPQSKMQARMVYALGHPGPINYVLTSQGPDDVPQWQPPTGGDEGGGGGSPSGAAGGDLSGTYPDPAIAAAVIVNADINASAAIALSKLASDPLARANHTGTQLASTISNFDTQVRASRLDQMAAPTADLAMGSHKLTGVTDPTSAQDAATKNYVDLVVISAQTGSYTLVLADGGKTVEVTSASAAVVTVPTNASVAFPIGTVIEIVRYGAGTLTITPASGVTLPNRVQAAGTTSRTLSSQMSSATIRKRATNVWHLVGDIA